jgi:NAD(P)-dependent dehydrogenase (short-subunit alcohol dehydrogenase family)
VPWVSGTLDAEIAETNVRVTKVHPGTIRTSTGVA